VSYCQVYLQKLLPKKERDQSRSFTKDIYRLRMKTQENKNKNRFSDEDR
jgi:hypothetical protein